MSLLSAVISALEGVTAGFTVAFCGAVSNLNFSGGTFVAFGVVSAVFNGAVNALLCFAVCHNNHPF